MPSAFRLTGSPFALSIADYGYVLETGTISLQGDSGQLLRDDHVRRSYLGHR
jgi:branched-chain amino acid transport system ATP-binding protein